MIYKPLRTRPRDGRVCLLRHAPSVMTGCEALRTTYQQERTPSCCGQGKTPKVNYREPSINPVRPQRRNGGETPHADSRRCLSIIVFPSDVQPGDRRYLKESYNVNHAEHGKPYEPCGIMAVSQPQGREMVQRVKELRKSECRPVIRRIGSHDPTRKGANFLVVEFVKSS
jgi:hypothetical protein